MITIKVRATDGLNYTKYFQTFFAKAGAGSPDVFVENHIGLFYEDTKVIDLYGEEFAYDFRTHIVSGNAEDMTFKVGNKVQLSVSGLDLSNPYGQAGELHDFVAALMGDGAPGTGTGVDAAAVRATLAQEPQHFIGNRGDDSYIGTDFADRMEGGRGRDKFKGGAGDDTFVLNARPGKDDADSLTDFKPGEDKIELDAGVFKALTPGKLKPSAFVDAAGPIDRNDHVIYDSRSGRLYYDDDATGPHQPELIAILPKGLPLSHTDFFVQ